MNPEFKKLILAEAKAAIEAELKFAGMSYKDLGNNSQQVMENIFIRGGETIMKLLLSGKKP